MRDKYIMALDQGTTSSRCIIYDRKGRMISRAQKEFRQIFPREGWVEHDGEEIFESQLQVAREALASGGLEAGSIAAIGITNQRETTLVWDRKTGKPVYNAIVWQCRRTAEFCDDLKAEGLDDIYREKTGLLIDPYFSATKIRWILDNVPEARERAEAGELLFGTVETWLIWKLTGGRSHVTDYSNASRTMLFNIHELKWDEDILRRLDIPACMLPEDVPSSGFMGETSEEFFGAPIPVCGAAGDQQAALFGQACFREGEMKNTYGTGGFMLMNTGLKPVTSGKGLLTTIAWGLGDEVYYALEGSVFVSGAVIQWLRDELGLIGTAAESEELARSVDSTGGVYIVPAFTGLGAPYWDPYARGVITGITRGTGKEHIVRAALEAMAYQTYDLAKAMEEDLGREIQSFRVDGGACANNFLMEFQAELLGREIYRPVCIETTSLGAAYLAGLACGYWESADDIRNNLQIDRIFTPRGSAETPALIEGWHEAVKKTT